MNVAIREELSTLKARKRRHGEAEDNVKKEAQMLVRREQLCQITTLQHFLTNNHNSSASNAKSNLERVQQTNAASSKRLQQIQANCKAEETVLKQSVVDFCEKLKQVETTSERCLEIESRISSLTSTTAQTAADVQDEEIKRLKLQLAACEQATQETQAKLSTVHTALQECEEECARLLVLTDEQTKLAKHVQESEGPQREQLDIITSFTKLKTNVHEKMSGHKINAYGNGKRVELILCEDGATIDMEFDSLYRAVHISTNSIISGSRIESELRMQALEQNNPALFVRKVKLLVHNSCVLERELQELVAVSSAHRFAIEYKPATRIVSCLFREAISVKLRIPFDYTVSPVELVQLESTIIRKRDVALDRQLEERVRMALNRNEQGNLVKHWVMRISELA